MQRHNTDVTSLVFGLLFLGVAVLWLLVHENVLALPALGVAAPVLLIAVGMAGILGSLSREGRKAPAETSTSDDRDW